MILNIEDLVKKVRVAIDEQLPADTDSEFSARLDTEIRHALFAACMQLCGEVPEHLLLPVTISNADIKVRVTNSDGTGMVSLPKDYLRLVKFKLTSWKQGVRQLLNPASNEARMQASPWTRGTPEKPRAMLGETRNGYRMLEYYTAGKNGNNEFDHSVECLCYVNAPVNGGDAFEVPLRGNCNPLIVYRAAGIVMEGKQNGDLADRFYKLSTSYPVEAMDE